MDPPTARPRPPLEVVAAATIARPATHAFDDVVLRTVCLGAVFCCLARPSPRITRPLLRKGPCSTEGAQVVVETSKRARLCRRTRPACRRLRRPNAETPASADLLTAGRSVVLPLQLARRPAVEEIPPDVDSEALSITGPRAEGIRPSDGQLAASSLWLGAASRRAITTIPARTGGLEVMGLAGSLTAVELTRAASNGR